MGRDNEDLSFYAFSILFALVYFSSDVMFLFQMGKPRVWRWGACVSSPGSSSSSTFCSPSRTPASPTSKPELSLKDVAVALFIFIYKNMSE
jgi:hypothetical protein